VNLALGRAPCQCAAWGSEAGGRCDASIAKRNIKWEGRETKKLNGTLLSDELGFLVFHPVRSIWGSLHGPKTNTMLSLPHLISSHVFTMWALLSSGTASVSYVYVYHVTNFGKK